MKKLFVFILTFLVGIVIVTRPVTARNYPQAVGYVNDFADVISQSVEKDLEAELSSFEASSSHELTVVTLSSLEDDVIENVAVELFEQWGIGKKEQDNGVLLLIAPNERKLRIEVGYGLEPVLTDSRAGNIVRTVITPEFKKDDYDTGVSQGVKAIKKVLTEDATAFDVAKSKTSDSSTSSGPIIIMFGGTLLTIYAIAFLSRSKRWWPGGVIGGGVGFLFGTPHSLIWGIIAAICLGGYGLFLDYIFSQNYKARKSKGLPTSWWSSGGGFSSGGGSSGSSFGGFSGGSSGGGGASGSW